MIPAGLKIRQLPSPPPWRRQCQNPEGKMTATRCTCRIGRCEFGPCEFCANQEDAERVRLAFVASDMYSTLEYLRRHWEHNGWIDSTNMEKVYESLALAQPNKPVVLPMAAE